MRNFITFASLYPVKYLNLDLFSSRYLIKRLLSAYFTGLAIARRLCFNLFHVYRSLRSLPLYRESYIYKMKRGCYTKTIISPKSGQRVRLTTRCLKINRYLTNYPQAYREYNGTAQMSFLEFVHCFKIFAFKQNGVSSSIEPSICLIQQQYLYQNKTN
jgi:hypothetical protein